MIDGAGAVRRATASRRSCSPTVRARQSGRARPVARAVRRAAAAGAGLPDGVPDAGEPGSRADRRARPASRRPAFSTRSPPSSAGAPPDSWSCRRCSGSARATASSPPSAGSASRCRWSSLAGYANALVLAALCVLQISVAAVGQDFYAFGWETAAGRDRLPRASSSARCSTGGRFRAVAPPAVVIWLLRWLVVRIMLGRRADQAARRSLLARSHLPRFPLRDAADPEPAQRRCSITCRRWLHKLGVLFNHVVELVAPFFVFGPRRAAPRRGRR